MNLSRIIHMCLLGVVCTLSLGWVNPAVAQVVAPPPRQLPRIFVTTNVHGAAFSAGSDGSPLLLKGFNYIRLRQGDHATFDAATKTTAANYDPKQAEAMLGTLHSNGFNVVRVFIIGRNAVNPGIGGDFNETEGVYGPYMENVLDFIRRAERHRVYVFPTFGDGELPRNRFYQSRLSKAHPGINSIYFTKEGIAAKARYVADFLRYIKSREPGLMTPLLGVQCQNELSVDCNEWPFAVRQGQLQMPNGKSYDMGDSLQRRALMNEGIAHYHHELTKTVKEIDPHLLVSEGIFTMAAVGKSLENHQGIWPDSSKDKRFPPELVALGQGPLDFLDIHFYRGSKREDLAETFRAHMHSSRLDVPAMLVIRQQKPVILGEFGAFRFVESSHAEVVPNMVAIRDLALKAGIKGYLYWTYDCAEQKELYHATENGGLLLKKL